MLNITMPAETSQRITGLRFQVAAESSIYQVLFAPVTVGAEAAGAVVGCPSEEPPVVDEAGFDAVGVAGVDGEQAASIVAAPAAAENNRKRRCHARWLNLFRSLPLMVPFYQLNR